MRSTLLTAAFLAAGLAAPAGSAAEVFYVSPDGDDANPGTEAQPFATLTRARDAIRARKGGPEPGLRGGATVFVRGGWYFLTEPFRLTAEDSGTETGPIAYRAYPGEKPVLVGGRRVTGFAPYQGEILKADLAAQGLQGVEFRQLFFDGTRQHLARYPNYDPRDPYGGGWAYADGEPVPMYQNVPGEDLRSLRFKERDARTWARPQEGEVFVFPRYNWWNNIVRIASVDPDRRLVTLAADCSYPIRPGDRYYVRGLREELDAPGEWYLDRETWTLYFWPPTPLGDRPVYAPVLRTILELRDASHLVIRGFTIECCEGTAVHLSGCSDCLVAANTIRNAGDYTGNGVSVDGGRRNGVVGNDIYEVGRNAISLTGGDRVTLTPAENYAENNYIHHTGVFYKQGVGISLSGCGNRASHNLIHDCPRFGILFSGNNLLIEYNRIRHVNLETEDTGVVYTGGRDWISSRGTVIRYNFFSDSLGYGKDRDGTWVSPHFAWGIYLDDNTGGVDVIGNIVARCARACLHLHSARDNLIENNIFVEGGLYQYEYSGWTTSHAYWVNHLPTMIKGYESVAGQPAWQGMRNMHIHPEKAPLPDGKVMTGNVFRRNILYYRNPKAALVRTGNVPFDHNEFDANVIWHFGQPLLTGQSKLQGVQGPNLAPNPGFEDGEPGALPAGWRWQVRPNDSKAAIDPDVRFAGRQSVRIEGRGTTHDGRQKLWPNFVSDEIPATPGQTYRLAARLRAAEPGTQFGIMPQAYVANLFFWSKGLNAAADPEWREYEVVFRFPGPGDADYRPEMTALRIRVDVRQEAGTLWLDEVSLHEAVVLDEWESWRALGPDAHSIVADPGFANPDADDYRLQPDSPAVQLGFQPIPVDKIGPYEDELRASWPIVEAQGAREKPPGRANQTP